MKSGVSPYLDTARQWSPWYHLTWIQPDSEVRGITLPGFSQTEKAGFEPGSVALKDTSPLVHLPPSTFCPSTAGCSPPSMSSIVPCLLISHSSWFPPSLLRRLAIFYLIVPLISSLSLVATLCSGSCTYYPSLLLSAHLHFCFNACSVMLIISVLFLISEHVIISWLVRLGDQSRQNQPSASVDTCPPVGCHTTGHGAGGPAVVTCVLLAKQSWYFLGWKSIYQTPTRHRHDTNLPDRNLAL